MKNKSKEYELLLLYDILAASDCLWLLLPKNKAKQRKQSMKNKANEYKLLLLYDILAASDCLCSASTASTY